MATRGSRSGTVLKRPSRMALLEGGFQEQLLAGPASASGYLWKLSTKSAWQKRFFELRGPFLLYWSSEKQRRASTLTSPAGSPPGKAASAAGAIDLRRIAASSGCVVEGDQIALKSLGGRTISLKIVSPHDAGSLSRYAHMTRVVGT